MDKLVKRDEPALRKISNNLARDLDSAAEGQWVHVDRKGRVRSVRRYRLLQATSGVGVVFVASIPVVYGLMLGPVGAAIGLGVTGMVGLRAWPVRRLRRSAELIENDRLDEAEQLLLKVARGRTVARQFKATAILNLGVIEVRRGNPEGALTFVRRASPLFGRGKRRPFTGRKADYFEAQVLATLGRTKEAQSVIAGCGDPPEGEYLRVVHWSVELYVCLCAGGHELTSDELHERALKGLSMTTGVGLIALSAWAHKQAGDDDQAEHLLTEARDRMTRLQQRRIRESMPALVTWLERQDGWSFIDDAE